jgi:hypothetical protein
MFKCSILLISLLLYQLPVFTTMVTKPPWFTTISTQRTLAELGHMLVWLALGVVTWGELVVPCLSQPPAEYPWPISLVVG